MNGELDRALEASDPSIRLVARRACDAVLAIFPDAVVTVDEPNTRFGTTIGFGTTNGYKGLRFTITPERAHVTLGIAHGPNFRTPPGSWRGPARCTATSSSASPRISTGLSCASSWLRRWRGR